MWIYIDYLFIIDCGHRWYFSIDENQPAQDQTKARNPISSLIKRILHFSNKNKSNLSYDSWIFPEHITCDNNVTYMNKTHCIFFHKQSIKSNTMKGKIDMIYHPQKRFCGRYQLSSTFIHNIYIITEYIKLLHNNEIMTLFLLNQLYW